MRRRQLKWLWARLAQLQAMTLGRDELLMKLGAAQGKVPAAYRLVDVDVPEYGAGFTYALNRKSCDGCAVVKAATCCAPT